MKTTIIAASAVAFMAATSALCAQTVPGKPPGLHHKVTRQHPRAVAGYVPRHEMQARRSSWVYPGAFGYAPYEPSRIDRDLEMSRQAGGGAGGGGGGGGAGGM